MIHALKFLFYNISFASLQSWLQLPKSIAKLLNKSQLKIR